VRKRSRIVGFGKAGKLAFPLVVGNALGVQAALFNEPNAEFLDMSRGSDEWIWDIQLL
jgi:hypothetical protein